MTRYFYTDPLAAAWMAKHFGMRFTNGEHEVCVTPLVDAEADGIRFVHPDSLHLLELQGGDLVTNTHDPRNAEHRPCSGKVVAFINRRTSAYVDVGERHNGKREFCEDAAALRVVQRVGKPFHWPERETA